MELGKFQTLKIMREKDFGSYLEDQEGNAVLLPKKKIPQGKTVGDMVDVFIYRDSEDRLIATTDRPLLQVGEKGFLKVKSLTKIGAFLDIGLDRDILLPHREMRYEIKEGDRIEVYLYIDRSDRICATMYTRSKDASNVSPEEMKRLSYEHAAERIYSLLLNNFEGHVPYTDKTVTPQKVEEDFGMSKAEFKRGIGKLMKEGRIKITKTSIFCVF